MQDMPPSDAGRTRSRRRRQPPGPETPPGPPPAAGTLRDAALAHLARFSATEAGLVRVLDRRIGRWSRRALAFGDPPDTIEARAAEARQAARAVAVGLVGAGVVDDAAFAEARVRSLSRSGRSRRATLASLAQKGVAGEVAQAAVVATLPEAGDAELAAALVQARRRRIGPFARPDDGVTAVEADAETGAGRDPAQRRNRMLAMLARAGFARDVAERALDMDRDEAEARVAALRQG